MRRSALAPLALTGLVLVALVLSALVRSAQVLAIAAAPTPSSAAHSTRPASAFVRVDQLGYPPAATKRAYLMSSAPETGAVWALRRSSDGATVFSATVGSSLGRWSARFPYVYALDFDGVSKPGSYAIAVPGQAGVSSPPFSIDSPARLYAGALQNARSFYGNERDGPDFIRSRLRTVPGHLNDEHARTYLTPKVDDNGAFKGDLAALPSYVDAAGGWWDAGDYLKFVQTTGYTVSLMLIGVRDFPSQMGASAGRSDFTTEARFGVRWLLHMWDDRTRTLYYQVGIGDGNAKTISDHDIWRLPQADDHYGGHDPLYRYIRHRPVFRAGPPGSPVSPNLAGRDAAAFALCFQLFRQSHPALADRCLRSAEHIFALANTHPRGHLLTAIPWDFYPETEWHDDLELGAVELADAVADASRALPAGLPHSSPRYYLRVASRWAHAYITHATSDTLNLYDVSGLAHYELYRAIGRFGDPPGLAVGRRPLLADLGRQLLAARAIARRDPFGFGYPWDVEDTASHGFGLSVMASEYANLNGDPAYRSPSGRWLGNVLGANAWGSSLVIGDGTTFPDCPQHQVANIASSLDGQGTVLAGAVVEGPSAAATTGSLTHMRRCPANGGDRFARFNSRAVFRDNVQSYSTVEPAIDLTASSPLAFAWQISTPRPLGAG
jgi:endoglucanase